MTTYEDLGLPSMVGIVLVTPALVTVIPLKLLLFLELICALLVLLSFPDVELGYRSVAI